MLEKLKCFIFYGSIFMCVHAKKRCLMYLHVCIGRKGSYYNFSLFIHHGVVILEDLLITLADGIASMYLELISVDSSLSNEMNNLGLSLCTLSTRALQRLRNEVWVLPFLYSPFGLLVTFFKYMVYCCVNTLSSEHKIQNKRIL